MVIVGQGFHWGSVNYLDLSVNFPEIELIRLLYRYWVSGWCQKVLRNDFKCPTFDPLKWIGSLHSSHFKAAPGLPVPFYWLIVTSREVSVGFIFQCIFFQNGRCAKTQLWRGRPSSLSLTYCCGTAEWHNTISKMISFTRYESQCVLPIQPSRPMRPPFTLNRSDVVVTSSSVRQEWWPHYFDATSASPTGRGHKSCCFQILCYKIFDDISI